MIKFLPFYDTPGLQLLFIMYLSACIFSFVFDVFLYILYEIYGSFDRYMDKIEYRDKQLATYCNPNHYLYWERAEIPSKPIYHFPELKEGFIDLIKENWYGYIVYPEWYIVKDIILIFWAIIDLVCFIVNISHI